MTDEIQQMRQELEAGFQSGRLHPRTLLENAVERGDMEAAHLIAEIGPRYLRGGDKLAFAAQVKARLPRDEGAHKQQRHETREERASEIGSKVSGAVVSKRERRLKHPFTPSVGWNVPPRDDEGWRS